MILYYMIRSNNTFFGGRDEKNNSTLKQSLKILSTFSRNNHANFNRKYVFTRQVQVFEKQVQAQYMSN